MTIIELPNVEMKKKQIIEEGKQNGTDNEIATIFIVFTKVHIHTFQVIRSNSY